MTFRIMEKRCDQCLFGKDKIVSNTRRSEIIREITRKDSHFICHKMTGVACHGDWEQRGCGQMGRIAGRLNAIEFVSVPASVAPQRTASGPIHRTIEFSSTSNGHHK